MMLLKARLAGPRFLSRTVVAAAFLTATALLAWGRPAGAAAPVSTQCAGDCDGSGRVSTAELVTIVDIALHMLSADRCPSLGASGSDDVTVTTLVRAVQESLEGCPGTTPLPTRTASPTMPSTMTAAPTGTSTASPLPTETSLPPPTATSTATPVATLTPGPVCGDGMAQDPEECDDGNTNNGDGCDSNCQLEPGGNPCAGVPTQSGTAIHAVLVAGGFDSPLWVTAPPLDPHRVFVVERPGRIQVIKGGQVLPSPFLDITDRVWRTTQSTPERGLLSVAFHPDFENNGRFFVYYTNRDGNNVIARFHVGADPDTADESSEQILLTLNHPTYANHNGGELVFGPDGYLYAGTGDGGGAGDPFNNAQNDMALLGKLLRFDVDVDDPPYYRTPPTNPHPDAMPPYDLIWAMGLRNPWRYSFDRLTHDLYIADVGQDHWEEVDIQPADSSGGENYGWNLFEGNHCYQASCPTSPTGLTFPVLEYDHSQGCSITGGFVYRGCALPDLHGAYFYADYCSSFVRSFAFVDGAVTDQRVWTNDIVPIAGGPLQHISSFGEDARGEIYVCDLGDGKVFKLEQ